MPANRTRDPHRHQDRSREHSAQPGVFRAHPLPNLPHRACLVRKGSLGRRAGTPARVVVARAPRPDRPHRSSIIAMEGHHGAHANLHRNVRLAAASQGLSCRSTTAKAGPSAQRAAPGGEGASLRTSRRNPTPRWTLVGRREPDRGGRIRYFLSGEVALISEPSSPASLEGTMGLFWNGATARRGADNFWQYMRSIRPRGNGSHCIARFIYCMIRHNQNARSGRILRKDLLDFETHVVVAFAGRRREPRSVDLNLASSI